MARIFDDFGKDIQVFKQLEYKFSDKNTFILIYDWSIVNRTISRITEWNIIN